MVSVSLLLAATCDRITVVVTVRAYILLGVSNVDWKFWSFGRCIYAASSAQSVSVVG
jgi:hypothetical protein